ncbi:hypothetical protein J2W55_002781 [Mucilaginibacter pocheonensis]|uniref:Uncharacterized protein n=1 Tax=Mucilaginibacter pocheonensis TaxID=398050 RepID=A0ABU1TC19_9SPHI|nr:hypothetical protein [Mucilaginibacter pocheonensis]
MVNPILARGVNQVWIIHNITKIDYLEKSKIVVAGQHLPIGDTFKNAVKLKLGW